MGRRSVVDASPLILSFTRFCVAAGLLVVLFTLTATTVAAQTAAQRTRNSAILKGAITAGTLDRVSTPQETVRPQVTITRMSPERQKIVARPVLNGAAVLDVPFVAMTTPEAVLALKLTVRVDPGLRCSRNGCRGVVRVGLNDSARMTQRIPLPAAVPIQLFGPDMVEPESLSISVTNELKAVRIQSMAHSAILNVSAATMDATQIPLPVQKVQLGMNAASSTIDMFGLEKTELNIGPIEGLDPSDTVMVRLEAVGARVDPSFVQLTQGTMATVKLRSRNQASATITAAGPSYVNTTPVTLTVTFPWSFLLFTLIGGLMGGFFRQTFFGPSGSNSQKAGRIAASATMGVALTILVVLGVNLLGVPLPVGDNSEPAGFAIGAVAAVLADFVAGMWRNTPTKPADNPAPREHQPA